MVNKKLAAIGASCAALVTAAGLALGVATAPAAAADPPIGIGLLDPTCLVSVTLNGQLICLVYIPPKSTTPTTPTSPSFSTTSPTTTTSDGPPVTGGPPPTSSTGQPSGTFGP